MPRYKWDIKELLYEEDVASVLAAEPELIRRAIISFCWLTGARTTEILLLKGADIGFTEDFLWIRLKTLKLGKGGYKTELRTLEFTRPKGLDTNPYVETIVKYSDKIPSEQLLFSRDGERPMSSRWMEARVVGPLTQRTLGKWLTPYHFRHSVMQWLARNGASLVQLMHFKGAKSALSVQPYIQAVPSLIKLENLNRERALIRSAPRVRMGNELKLTYEETERLPEMREIYEVERKPDRDTVDLDEFAEELETS